MLLYVMRHGPAEDRAPTGRDFDRALTQAGREVVARAARALHEARRAQPSRFTGSTGSTGSLRLLSSPLRRARETAEIVASLAIPTLEVELHDDSAVDAEVPHRLVADLAAAGADALLVGHQPVVEHLVTVLQPARPSLPGGFRTALIVVVERVGPDFWRSAAVLDPHQARR